MTWKCRACDSPAEVCNHFVNRMAFTGKVTYHSWPLCRICAEEMSRQCWGDSLLYDRYDRIIQPDINADVTTGIDAACLELSRLQGRWAAVRKAA
jgi:hypothetical protein